MLLRKKLRGLCKVARDRIPTVITRIAMVMARITIAMVMASTMIVVMWIGRIGRVMRNVEVSLGYRKSIRIRIMDKIVDKSNSNGKSRISLISRIIRTSKINRVSWKTGRSNSTCNNKLQPTYNPSLTNSSTTSH